MAKVHPDPALPLPESGVTEELSPTVLTVWRKSLLFNCDGFTVFDSSGDLAFRVDCYGSSSGGSRSRRHRRGRAEDVVLMGPAGAPLLTVRRKRLSLAEHWVIYDGDGGSDGDSDPRPLLSVRRCHAGFRHAHASSSSSKQKALAHITPLASAPSVSGAEAYVVEGSYARRSVAVRDVARGGEAAVVAEVRRKESPVGDEVFRLVVPDPSCPLLPGAASAGSASKRPRAASAAASYAESLRSQLRPDASILASLRSLASASSKSKPVSSSSSAATKALAEDDPASASSSYIGPSASPILSGRRRRPPPARSQTPPPWQPGHLLPAPLQPFRPPARTPPAAASRGVSAAGGGEAQAAAAEEEAGSGLT